MQSTTATATDATASDLQTLIEQLRAEITTLPIRQRRPVDYPELFSFID